MRVLIISAVILACATAAPSGSIVAPLILSPIPTVDPGDIQAAAINAQVFAEDQAQAVIDKARELNEKAVENVHEQVNENNDLVKEKTVEQFWSIEDKKWQALDAVRTAEAKIDGSIANNADIIAKSAIGGVLIPTAYISPISGPIVAPVVSPLVYATPGIIATKPEVTEPIKEEKKIETVKEENIEAVKEEKIEEVKSAETGKEEKVEEVKAAEPEKDKFVGVPLSPATIYSTQLAYASGLNAGALALAPGIPQPWLAGPVAFVPQTYASAPIHQIHTPVLTPTLIKTQW